MVNSPVSDPYLNKQFGSVRLIRKLGQGSMGMVYHGFHEAFKSDVAVKLLKPVNNENKEQFYQRFLREGRAAARVRHENVVQVMDAGHEHGHAFLVLEFVKGASLGEVLEQKGCIDPKTVMHLGEQIANGLAAIHQEGIIHRDVKPDNILLGLGGSIKIADLGLAKELDHESVNRLTMSGMVVGTPYYISPEAITDVTNAKAPADIYSFGATLYHLLTGKPPFEGASAYEVMRAHLEQRFQPIREINRNINPNLANLVERCLDKNADKRPSAKEISTIISRGGRVQSTGRGVGFLAAIVIAMIGSCALLFWNVLNKQQAASELVLGENASHMSIQASHPNSEIKIDKQKWQPLQNDITIGHGKHTVSVRNYEDGTLMLWQDQVDVASEDVEIAAQLKPISIKPIMVPVMDTQDKSSYVYINGRCIGAEQHARFEHAGHYAVAIWQADHRWRWTQIEIDINGSSSMGDWLSSDQAPQEAFYRSYVNHESCQPHHMLSWYTCDRIRTSESVLEPVGWNNQALEGHQYAYNLSPALVLAVEIWAGQNAMRLPSIEEATRLKALYNASFWYSNGRNRRVLGNQHTALVALVPQDP